MPLLIAAGVFATVCTLILSLQMREQERAGFSGQRLARAMGKGPPLNYSGTTATVALRGSRISSSDSLTHLLSSVALAQRIERLLNRSDWNNLKVSDFFVVSVAAGALPFAVVLSLSGSLWIGAAVGLVGAFMPRYLLGRNIKKRRNKFNNQLVDVLTQMANSMKAGFGLLQAIASASDEAKAPISTELRQTIHDIQVGSDVEVAFNDMNDRVGSEDLDIVITAILVQRGAGGSLSEIMEGVAHTMRERIRIRGEIATLTAQGKYTGYLIGALPIFLAGGFFVVNRSYEILLFTTTLGHVLLAGWAVMQTIGLLIIRKILSIEL